MQRAVWSQGKSILSVVASAACHRQLHKRHEWYIWNWDESWWRPILNNLITERRVSSPYVFSRPPSHTSLLALGARIACQTGAWTSHSSARDLAHRISLPSRDSGPTPVLAADRKGLGLRGVLWRRRARVGARWIYPEFLTSSLCASGQKFILLKPSY